MATLSSRRRQPLLFAVAGPWMERFGEGFFRELPRAPGVYFFRDAEGRLLYIGQSKCLRTRIGSYRQVDPERNPRRTLRLIRRTCRIEWELCPDGAAAVAREAALLLEHRPPFNRAGVWVPPDSGLRWLVADGRLELEMIPAPPAAGEAAGEWIGPLPGRFRRAFVPLARCLFRAMHPEAGWWDYPAGLLAAKPGVCVGWRLPSGYETPLAEFRAFMEMAEEVLPWLTGGAEATDGGAGHDAAFWAEQAEEVAAFHEARGRRLRGT